MLKILRRGSARYLLFSGVLLTVLVCLYYANYNTAANSTATVASRELAGAPAAAVAAVADGGGAAAAAGVAGASGAAKADGAARKDGGGGGDGALAAPVETRAAGPGGGAGDEAAAAAAPDAAAAAAAEEEWMEPDSAINEETCPIMPGASTDVDTVEQFKKFEFQYSEGSVESDDLDGWEERNCKIHLEKTHDGNVQLLTFNSRHTPYNSMFNST